MLRYKLDNAEGLKADDLRDLIQNRGARVLFFQYRLGLIIFSIPRISAPILTRNEEELRYYKPKYCLLSLLGIFQIPTGIFRVIADIQSNLKMELDFTKDFLYNLEHFEDSTGFIEIRKAYTLFMKLSNSDLSEMKKAILDYCNKTDGLKSVCVGKYINQSEGTPYMIGLDYKGDRKKLEAELLVLIYKRFYQFLVFQFIYKETDDLLFDRLKEQGQSIK